MFFFYSIVLYFVCGKRKLKENKKTKTKMSDIFTKDIHKRKDL